MVTIRKDFMRVAQECAARGKRCHISDKGQGWEKVACLKHLRSPWQMWKSTMDIPSEFVQQSLGYCGTSVLNINSKSSQVIVCCLLCLQWKWIICCIVAFRSSFDLDTCMFCQVPWRDVCEDGKYILWERYNPHFDLYPNFADGLYLYAGRIQSSVNNKMLNLWCLKFEFGDKKFFITLSIKEIWSNLLLPCDHFKDQEACRVSLSRR